MSYIIDRYLEQLGKTKEFLDPKLDEEFGISLTGIKDGVELIKDHISRNSKILIYTDYDCDGSTGAVVLDLMFRTLEYTNYDVLLNERIFGNGFNNITINTIKNIMPIGLVITADHASSNENYIKELRDIGVDVIVTDHHHLKDNTPPKSANVFINPQQETNDKYKYISGCATAFALAKQVIKGHSNENLYMDNMLELVAVSTIGDMMNMSNEINRHITKLGIQKLNTGKLGKAYRRLMGYPNEIDSKDISFTLVPMINSCSRVASASLAYLSLLPPKTNSKHINNIVDFNTVTSRGQMNHTMSEHLHTPKTWDEHQSDEIDIDNIINNLEQLKLVNLQRKKKQADILGTAIKQINPNDIVNVIVLQEGNGINGIISSQIGYQTKKPTITFIHGNETCSGSCRGIAPDLKVKDCFDWISNVDSNVFAKKDGSYLYGGHDGAAGCTVNTGMLNRFKELFIQYMLDNKIEYKEDMSDIIVKSIEITKLYDLPKEIESIKRLEPFGNNYPSPLLRVRFELIKNYKQIPISATTKLIKFDGVVNDLTIECSMFTDRETDIEVRDKELIGSISFTRKTSFDIKHIIP